MKQVVVGDPQYETLTLIDFLKFFNQPHQMIPTARLSSDTFWKEEMIRNLNNEDQRKVTCITPEVFPEKDDENEADPPASPLDMDDDTPMEME